MHFGLKNSPTFFARVINEVLYKVLGPQCLVYLDGIIIFSKTCDEHLQTIKAVLEALEEAGLKLKLNKGHLFAKEIEFIAYK